MLIIRSKSLKGYLDHFTCADAGGSNVSEETAMKALRRFHRRLTKDAPTDPSHLQGITNKIARQTGCHIRFVFNKKNNRPLRIWKA